MKGKFGKEGVLNAGRVNPFSSIMQAENLSSIEMSVSTFAINFLLHSKECKFRFYHSDEDLHPFLLKITRAAIATPVITFFRAQTFLVRAFANISQRLLLSRKIIHLMPEVR